MDKKQNKLEDLTKEELIKKCINQKNKIKDLEKQLELKTLALSDLNYFDKIKIYMNETLSLMEDIEKLKELKNG